MFARQAPKGVLLYGPPGTGKTLLARALASNISATFLKVVASAIVDKYIGESARIIREMFGFAKDHQPCVIFMDEIDAIGGSRFSEGTSADREIQRTLMELLNCMDGFEDQGQVKMVMATNRPDVSLFFLELFCKISPSSLTILSFHVAIILSRYWIQHCSVQDDWIERLKFPNQMKRSGLKFSRSTPPPLRREAILNTRAW